MERCVSLWRWIVRFAEDITSENADMSSVKRYEMYLHLSPRVSKPWNSALSESGPKISIERWASMGTSKDDWMNEKDTFGNRFFFSVSWSWKNFWGKKPYLEPTLVDFLVWSESRRRNSANCSRTFGRREIFHKVRDDTYGGDDCLVKAQDSAKSTDEV